MSVLDSAERAFLEAVSELAFCNPFLPERVVCEQAALGNRYVSLGEVWHAQSGVSGESPNVLALREKAAQTADGLRDRLAGGPAPTPAEKRLYEDLVTYVLYERHQLGLYAMLTDPGADAARGRRLFDSLQRDLTHYLGTNVLGKADLRGDAAHLLACFFQLRRAFHHIFRYIMGGSGAAARLRGEVWQSIFTRDMRRYRRSLYAHMRDVTVLVSGPSGTGKELVARAVGLCQYVPFDPACGRFAEDWRRSFLPLSISALSPTLVESELFGHRRGAFTGALDDHIGWLEACEPAGTVFLDEIGETTPEIQVKLLRALETRSFCRLGETDARHFDGKIIAATNRDLQTEIQAGRFRADLYYRLCADVITTPTLQEQLCDAKTELPELVNHITRRLVGDGEAPDLAREVVQWIDRALANDYPWPGNVRELEQCVRNVMIRGSYRPAALPPTSLDQRLLHGVRQGTLSADELLSLYCTKVYAECRNYEETGRRLGLDRRTVKSKINCELLPAQ